jgi:hypothetical protein
LRHLQGRGGWKADTEVKMERLRHGCRGRYKRKAAVKGARKDLQKNCFMNRQDESGIYCKGDVKKYKRWSSS